MNKRIVMFDNPMVLSWKHLWDTWNIRGLVILSLLLQTLLILLGPLRKRTSSNWIITPLWLFYLLADWVANYVIGLAAKGQQIPSNLSGQKEGGAISVEKDLLSFWAPFLLLHLGGPDTITAFALEDNEFWLRHLLGLVFQFSATMYVFVQSLPNKLWVPTILMIMNGTIKYTERTLAFYRASADKFRSSMLENVDPGMNYIRLKEEGHSVEEVERDTTVEMIQDQTRHLTEIEVVQYANDYFNKFKGLVVDLVFTRKTRNESRDFFLHLSAKDAFKVVEVELNLFYEALYTKLPVVCGYFGAFTRLFSFGTVCAATILFKFGNKSAFSNIDVKITYSLLFGALTLDVVNLFILLFSNKTIINTSRSTRTVRSFLTGRISSILEGPNQEVGTKTHEAQTHIQPIAFLKRRWSNCIPTYNLIYYCLHPHPRFNQLIYDKLGVSSFFDDCNYVKTKRFTTQLRNFIFEELKSKSQLANDLDTAIDLSSSRGDWVLSNDDGWRDLLPHTLDGDFGQRILLWHIATDLCYSKELSYNVKSKSHITANVDFREIAKLLSDYMMYLLIRKPSMMPAITSIVQIQFWDLCANAKSILKNERAHVVNEVQRPIEGSRNAEVDWEHLNACMKIYDQYEMRLKTMKCDVTKSLLVYSFILAKEVMKIEEEDKRLNKWLIISKVWVELLCYGASHSQAKMQAAQVSKGGDLITVVWLLMAHFGLGDQFQIDEHQERARRSVN